MAQTESKIRLIFEGAERGVGAAAAKARAAMRGLDDDTQRLVKSSKAATDVDKERAKALSDLSDNLGTAGKWAGLFGVATGAGAAAVGAALPALGSLALGFGVAKAAIGGSTAALDAYDKAMKDGKGDFTEYNRLLKGMTPEQRAFTEAVVATKAPLSELQKTAGRSFLPGVTKFLTDSQSLFPLLDHAVARTGKIMGDTASKLGDLFKSADFQQSLEDMLRSSDIITKAIGDNFVKLTGKVVEFGGNMGPAAEGFATALDDIEAGLEGFLSGLEPYSADFKSIFESVGSILRDLLPIVGQLAGALAADLAPILRDVAGWIDRNKDAISAWVPFIADAVLALGGFKLALAGIKAANAVGDLLSLGGAFFGVGGKAGEAEGKVRGFAGGLGLIKGALVVGAVAAFAVELDKANVAAAGGAENLQGFERNLHNIVGAAGQLASGDISGILRDIGAQVSATNATWKAGEAPAQQWAVSVGNAASSAAASVQNFFRGLVGLPPLPPIKVDANTDPATGKVNDWVGGVSRARGTAQLDADASRGNNVLGGWKGSANATVGTAHLGAEAGAANGTRSGWQSAANGTVGVAHLHAESGAANAQLGGWRGAANATVGTAHLTANTSAATGAINAWRSWASSIVVTVRAVLSKIGFAGGGPVLPGMATGGPIAGPGSGTSDQAGMFALSAGEWVMTAREVRNAGGFAGMARLAAALDRGRPLGLAGGGPTMASSARSALRPAPVAAAPSSGGVQVSFAGNTSDALATVIMQMIRTNKIQLKAA